MTTTAATLARLVFDFLDNADSRDAQNLVNAFGEIAANACPQGAAIKVAYLNQLVAAAANGGEVGCDAEIEEAKVRKVTPPAPGYYDERLDADDDIRCSRDLKRLLTANAKRAAKASRDILAQVPN